MISKLFSDLFLVLLLLLGMLGLAFPALAKRIELKLAEAYYRSVKNIPILGAWEGFNYEIVKSRSLLYYRLVGFIMVFLTGFILLLFR